MAVAVVPAVVAAFAAGFGEPVVAAGLAEAGAGVVPAATFADEMAGEAPAAEEGVDGEVPGAELVAADA